MTLFGWDASDYDWPRGSMDLAAAARDGIVFFTHKATEGTTRTHVHYGEALRRARDAGIAVLGAYHVVRSPADAPAEVDHWLSYMDRETPWWRTWPDWFFQVDLEKWPYDAVPAGEGESVGDLVEARTGRRAIIYASRGQYGDGLAGTSHELWNADYPTWRTALGRCPAAPYRKSYVDSGGDGGRGWTSYSGRTPKLWQFTDNATIGSQPGCDANAFRGSLGELRALVRGDDMAGETADWAASHVGVPGKPGEFQGSHLALGQLLESMAELRATVADLQARASVALSEADRADLAARVAAQLAPALIPLVTAGTRAGIDGATISVPPAGG